MSATASVPRRLESIDIVRGFVINNPASIPDWYGLLLPGVYLVWAIVVLLLYYPCAQLGRMKVAHPKGWHRFV